MLNREKFLDRGLFMKIDRLRVNHIKNPVGYELGRPVLSWVVSGSTG